MEITKKIPIKNYIILSLIIIISIFIIIYCYVWYGVYEKENLNISVSSQYFIVIQYNELDNYLTENKDAIIYVSGANNDEIKKFEKKFIKLINKYSLNNSILYLNISNKFKDNEKKHNLFSEDVPYIIVFENGDIKSRFDVKNNNYNIDLVTNYLISEGVIDD